ncbi:MAG: SO_0444 family Cu/Zn efflux transporter [Gammaproteobacteria bacterium]|nr:SO_0444 family Cu/Zn efflux transporter [Gammaproteobacteria bacterium]
MTILNTFLANLWWMIAESAPWLLLGFLIAGVINELVPAKWIKSSLGGRGYGAIFKAAIVGAPLPLCSCGVIPTAVGIRRAGASRGATSSFLVATPETGVDSVSITYALMGPVMAIVRPIAAIISAIVSGTLVQSLTRTVAEQAPAQPAKKSCCGHNSNSVESVRESRVASVISAIRSVFAFSFGKLLKDITKWLAIGLIGAALIKTFVPDSFFVQWGSGLWAMLAMIVIGIPMYICATASTPLAAGLIMAGVSPGTALVFMLTGPATNIATLGVIKNELGAKALLGHLTGVIVSAILAGSLLDYLIAKYQWQLTLVAGHQHSDVSFFASISAIVLITLVVLNYLPKRLQPALNDTANK